MWNTQNLLVGYQEHILGCRFLNILNILDLSNGENSVLWCWVWQELCACVYHIYSKKWSVNELHHVRFTSSCKHSAAPGGVNYWRHRHQQAQGPAAPLHHLPAAPLCLFSISWGSGNLGTRPNTRKKKKKLQEEEWNIDPWNKPDGDRLRWLLWIMDVFPQPHGACLTW